MLSTKKLKTRFYTHHLSPFKHFNQQAQKLVTEELVVLNAGCGADDSIGLRTESRLAIGIDMDTWILRNSDIDVGVIGDLAQFPFAEQCIDVVISRWVLEHLRYPDKFFYDAARVLKPGGHLLLLTPNRWHYAGAITSVVPHRMQKWFVKSLLHGNPAEVFPTYYRANTPHRLKYLAAQAGLVTEDIRMLEGAPSLLGFSPFTYILEFRVATRRVKACA